MIAFEHKEEAAPAPPADKKAPGAGKKKDPNDRRKVSLPWPRSEEWRKPEAGAEPGREKR